MLYTIPDYYKEFSCIATDCEDTCCAGWQIVIDEKSKRRYAKAATGLNNIEKNLARELRRCVNWRQGVFRQDTEKRCSFLNRIISAGFIRWRDRTACAGLVKCIRAT